MEELRGSFFADQSSLIVLNPELKIASLDPSVHLGLELQVNLGRGYVPSEVNEKFIDVVGTIPMDAIFTPVKKVNTRLSRLALASVPTTTSSCSKSGQMGQ